VSELIKANFDIRQFTNIVQFEMGAHPAFPESGKQLLIRFENNYGISVIQFACPPLIPGQLFGSYGVNNGLYELAVTRYKPEEKDIFNFELCYSTPITNDVLGYLTEQDVMVTAAQVAALPEERV
jgi:hypothetical protein